MSIVNTNLHVALITSATFLPQSDHSASTPHLSRTSPTLQIASRISEPASGNLTRPDELRFPSVLLTRFVRTIAVPHGLPLSLPCPSAVRASPSVLVTAKRGRGAPDAHRACPSREPAYFCASVVRPAVSESAFKAVDGAVYTGGCLRSLWRSYRDI